MESGEEAEACEWHARFFCGLAEAADPKLTSAARPAWMGPLETERQNLRAALDWCLQGGGDRRLGLQLAGALGWYWYFAGFPSEGRHWLAKALEATCADGDGRLLGRAVYGASMLAFMQGDSEGGSSLARDSAEAYARAGNRLGQGRALAKLGLRLTELGQAREAMEAYDQSISILRSLDAGWFLGLALCFASDAAWLVGEAERARARGRGVEAGAAGGRSMAPDAGALLRGLPGKARGAACRSRSVAAPGHGWLRAVRGEVRRHAHGPGARVPAAGR